MYERFKFVCAYCEKITHKSRFCDKYEEGVSTEVYEESILAHMQGRKQNRNYGFRHHQGKSSRGPSKGFTQSVSAQAPAQEEGEGESY
ncbi:hypothetical protein Syun_009729 [Stephania yunnanensis]|uniref:Uncharacterized protein n=1 Tax=Stephania yunnanensis TaxID=152371 RepID=A0AAP0PR46_9MAGN